MEIKYTESQKEKIEEFGLYLDKCAKVSADAEPYNEIYRIDECLHAGHSAGYPLILQEYQIRF